MTQPYYKYGKEELLQNPGIPLYCLESNQEVFRQMAGQMADEIRGNNEKGEKTVMICPVGPVGQYPFFVELVNSTNLDLKNTWFLNMDEYLDDEKNWISKDHPLSFRGFMDREVYSKLNRELVMPPEQRVFPDPKNITYIPELIQKLGGVDLVLGGIGINGHVAFNEADSNLTNEEFLQLKTRVLDISPETRAANAIGDFSGNLEDMPKYCVTIGISEIYHAKKIRLGCFRNWHRAVVRRAAYGEASAEFPVTLLRDHRDITLTFTEFVAELDEKHV